jgi:hypothetical protein
MYLFYCLYWIRIKLLIWTCLDTCWLF